jgi:uncharacterized membrane protein YjjB (DUF3815 family)
MSTPRLSLHGWIFIFTFTFGYMYAVPNMDFFCSHLISCFPDVLLGYFLNDFEMVPAASIVAGITSGLYSTHPLFPL